MGLNDSLKTIQKLFLKDSVAQSFSILNECLQQKIILSNIILAPHLSEPPSVSKYEQMADRKFSCVILFPRWYGFKKL